MRPINGLRRIAVKIPSRTANYGRDPSDGEEGDEVVVFPGLNDKEILSRVFRNRRIILLGDSTLRIPGKNLAILLSEKCGGRIKRPWSNYILFEANLKMAQKAKSCAPMRIILDGKDIPPTIRSGVPFENATTLIKFLGPMFGYICRHGCEGLLTKTLEDAWNAAFAVKEPNVLIINMGLHWQHFLGRGRDGVGGSEINAWLNYEDQWLQRAVDNASKMGVKLLLIKTNNFICEDRFVGDFANGTHHYGSRDPQVLNDTLKVCEEIASSRLPSASKEQISRYCRHGTFNDHGAMYLNRRIYDYVNRLPDIPDLKVGVYNTHDLQSCPYTPMKDGRHYRQLALIEVRLLANILDCADMTWNTTFQSQMKDLAAKSIAQLPSLDSERITGG